MQHERARCFARFVDGVEALCIFRRTQRRSDKGLRLPTRKERGAVRSRQHGGVNRDGTDLIGLPPVDTQSRRQYLCPQLVVLDVAQNRTDILRVVRELRRQLLRDSGLCCFNGLHTRLLVLLIQRLANRARTRGLRALHHQFRRLRLLPRHLRLPRLGQQLVLHVDQLADAIMRDFERLQYVRFGHFKRATLNHNNRVRRAGNNQLQVRKGQLLKRRIQHPVPLHSTDAHTADWAGKRNPGCVQGKGRSQKRQHVRGVLLVGRYDVDEHLHFVLEALRKQGPNRAVDNAAGQNFVIVGTTLALDETARDLPRRVGLLLILDRQWEKRQRTLIVADRDGGEHHRLTKLDQRGSGCLFGHATGLNDQRATGECPLDTMHHLLCFLTRTQIARAA